MKFWQCQTFRAIVVQCGIAERNASMLGRPMIKHGNIKSNLKMINVDGWPSADVVSSLVSPSMTAKWL